MFNNPKNFKILRATLKCRIFPAQHTHTQTHRHTHLFKMQTGPPFNHSSTETSKIIGPL